MPASLFSIQSFDSFGDCTETIKLATDVAQDKFLKCAPSLAEVVACELKAIRANSEEHDCMGSTAASRPIVAGTTRLISEATYVRSDTFRLPRAGARNFGAVRR